MKNIIYILILTLKTTFLQGSEKEDFLGKNQDSMVKNILEKFSSKETSPYLADGVITPFYAMQEEPNLVNLLNRCDPNLATCQDPLEIALRLFPIITDLFVTHGSNTPIGQVIPNNYPGSKSQLFYSDCLRKYYGYACGGRGWFFATVLKELYGVNAFSLNLGNYGCSHVITVIAIKSGNTYLFYPFDLYHGCYLTDLSGNLIDLKTLFSGASFQENLLYFNLKFALRPEEASTSYFSSNGDLLLVLNPSLYIYGLSTCVPRRLLNKSLETLEDHTKQGGFVWEKSIPFFTFEYYRSVIDIRAPCTTMDPILLEFRSLLNLYSIKN